MSLQIYLKNNWKWLLGSCFSATLGFIFMYSAYTKLWPLIETFEFSFVDIGIANWYTAPIIARLFIALEIFTGLLLIAGYNLRRFTLPFTIALLVLFVIYLLFMIMSSGNGGNCGCFGEHHYMSPLMAIVKNVVMIVMALATGYLMQGWKSTYAALILSLVGLSAIVVPFIINPVEYTYTSNNVNEAVNYRLDMEPLYNPDDSSKCEVPGVELRKGKHVLALLSLTCSHCRVAAKKFRLIKKNNPELPIYFILNGDTANYRPFINDTKANNIPSSFCLGRTFIKLASMQLPRIYYLDNSTVVKKVDYFELNQYNIENWVETGKVK